MDNNDSKTLLHIAHYCEDITGFIERFGNDFQTFTNDRAYYNAVSMCIMQIGEISNKLSSKFRNETDNQIPWEHIRGMRNWFAHNYQAMNEDLIWETASKDIPELLELCNKILEVNESVKQIGDEDEPEIGV